jgi:hypothetical protein
VRPHHTCASNEAAASSRYSQFVFKLPDHAFVAAANRYDAFAVMSRSTLGEAEEYIERLRRRGHSITSFFRLGTRSISLAVSRRCSLAIRGGSRRIH